jgi:selenocysteine lyase/cysteine desulfurase
MNRLLMQTMSCSELDGLRAETPAWGRFAHFAHGSISLPAQVVFDAMQGWQQLEAQQGAHRAIAMVREALDESRAVAARLISAQAHQIAFIDSASRAWALAMAASYDNAQRVDVITSEHEWGGNAINLLHAHRQGRIGLHVVRAVDGESLGEGIRRKLDVLATDPAVRIVVSLPAVAMTDGSVIDLRGIAVETHRHKGLLFVDASHAVGQLPIDVQSIGCDVLMFPARKWLRGPKGISVLYLSDRALGILGAPPTLEIASAIWDSDTSTRPRDDARRFEVYEFNPGLRLGFMAAAEYAMQRGLERIAVRNASVREQLRGRLARELDLHTIGTGIGVDSAFLTYRVNNVAAVGDVDAVANKLIRGLEDNGINASLIGKQYARWAMTSRSLQKLLRLTPHYITDEAECDRLMTCLGSFRNLLD